MGNLATPEALLVRWDELCRDPSLRDLPYKIELNAWGKVEMSPASVQHAWLQGEALSDPYEHRHTHTRCRMGFRRLHAPA